jgi:biotin carboxylase
MKHAFEKIALVARGEAAVRLIRAIRELNHEQHLSLAAAALFTEPDARRYLCVRPMMQSVLVPSSIA